MVSVVSCPSCGAPISHGVVACTFCRVALTWPGAPSPVAMGVPDAPAGVVEHLRGGNKLLAIKTYQTATKCGLLEAKKSVEDLERRLGLA
ncbi:MAG TPA: hypothetical protein PLR99_24875 [Polyangiaceae bacterium]|nr:hypothetical protein [Polyangiaceae bacterium]